MEDRILLEILEGMKNLQNTVDRVVEVSENTNARLNVLEGKVDSLNSRLSSVETRIDSVDSRLVQVEADNASIIKRLDKQEKKIEMLSVNVSSLNQSVSSLIIKVDENTDAIKDLNERFEEFRDETTSRLDGIVYRMNKDSEENAILAKKVDEIYPVYKAVVNAVKNTTRI